MENCARLICKRILNGCLNVTIVNIPSYYGAYYRMSGVRERI